jgi:rfaE bifunctional protein nucleotidyltransferase chain/domain
MLREASRQGDVLVVGVNSDASIRKLKGPNRPIRREDERAEIVAAMEMVSFVVLFDERESTSFVARVRPDVHVNDATYGEDCVEAKVLREYGGRLHLIPKFQWESNSDLVERIKTLS